MPLRIGGKDGFVPGISRRQAGAGGLRVRAQVLAFRPRSSVGAADAMVRERHPDEVLHELVGRYVRTPERLAIESPFTELLRRHAGQSESIHEMSEPDYHRAIQASRQPWQEQFFRPGINLVCQRWREFAFTSAADAAPGGNSLWVLRFKQERDLMDEVRAGREDWVAIRHGDLFQSEPNGDWQLFYDPRVDSTADLFPGGHLYPSDEMPSDLVHILSFIAQSSGSTQDTAFRVNNHAQDQLMLRRLPDGSHVLRHTPQAATQAFAVYRAAGGVMHMPVGDKFPVPVSEGDVVQYGEDQPFVFDP